MVQIDKADGNQNGGKNEINEEIKRQAVLDKQQQGQKAGHQLDQRVAP